MNLKELTDKVKEANKAAVNSAVTTADNHSKNFETVTKLHALLNTAFPKVLYTGIEYFTVHGVKSFKDMERVMESAEMLGLTVENWNSTDYPESKNRDFQYKLPSGSRFLVSLYLSADADCKLVEVSRTTEEKVEYRLECGDAS